MHGLSARAEFLFSSSEIRIKFVIVRVVQNCSNRFLYLLFRMDLMEIIGKQGRKVSLMIPQDAKQALELLVAKCNDAGMCRQSLCVC